ncbi:MAG: hypothetical protein H8Z69_04400 [Nanohaloarchaea archaeon]|nr:hypothetical protein [Candidatus Nanohaloarchaea archaeon]
MKTKTITILAAVLLLVGGAAAQTTTSDRASTQIQPSIINTDPVPVQSGEDAEINLKIRNTGNTEAKDVKVQIVDSFPFELKPDRKRNHSLGNIVPGQEYQISTELLVADNAPDGMNDLKLKITQGDVSITREVPVQIQSQNIELNLANLKTSPSTLTPDTEDAKMTLEVVNNGEKTAENVVLNIDLPEGFEQTSSFSTRQALGNIQPGQVKPASFNFDVKPGAEVGGIQIPTDIAYSTDSSQSTSRITEETEFGFNLAGKPRFEVVNVESKLKTGSTEQLKIELRNIGSEKSSSTRIRVLDSADLPFSYSSSSKYIGTLEPNQTGTAVFEVETETGAVAKDYLLDFEIRGVKDTQVYVEDTTVKSTVSKSESNDSSTPLIPAVVVLVVVGAGFYFRDRIRGLIS